MKEIIIIIIIIKGIFIIYLKVWLRLFIKVFFTRKCIKIIFFLFFKNYF